MRCGRVGQGRVGAQERQVGCEPDLSLPFGTGRQPYSYDVALVLLLMLHPAVAFKLPHPCLRQSALWARLQYGHHAHHQFCPYRCHRACTVTEHVINAYMRDDIYLSTPACASARVLVHALCYSYPIASRPVFEPHVRLMATVQYEISRKGSLIMLKQKQSGRTTYSRASGNAFHHTIADLVTT